MGSHRWLRNQFPPFSSFLHYPLGLGELQACPFPYVVFPFLPSALSSSPYHCALQDGFGQTWWMGGLSIPLQFASLYGGHEVNSLTDNSCSLIKKKLDNLCSLIWKTLDNSCSLAWIATATAKVVLHVYLHVRTHACVCVRVRAHMHTCAFLCLCMWVQDCMCTSMCVYMHVCTCAHLCEIL